MGDIAQTENKQPAPAGLDVLTKLTVLTLALVGFVKAWSEPIERLQYFIAAFVLFSIVSILFWTRTKREQSEILGGQVKFVSEYGQASRILVLITAIIFGALATYTWWDVTKNDDELLTEIRAIHEYEPVAPGLGEFVRTWARVENDRMLVLNSFVYFEVTKSPKHGYITIRDVSFRVLDFEDVPKQIEMYQDSVTGQRVNEWFVTIDSDKSTYRASPFSDRTHRTSLTFIESVPIPCVVNISALKKGVYTVLCDVTVSSGKITKTYTMGKQIKLIKASNRLIEPREEITPEQRRTPKEKIPTPPAKG